MTIGMPRTEYEAKHIYAKCKPKHETDKIKMSLAQATRPAEGEEGSTDPEASRPEGRGCELDICLSRKYKMSAIVSLTLADSVRPLAVN